MKTVGLRSDSAVGAIGLRLVSYIDVDAESIDRNAAAAAESKSLQPV